MVSIQEIKLSFITAQLMSSDKEALRDCLEAQSIWLKVNINNIEE